MSQPTRDTGPQPLHKEDDLGTMLVGVLGIVIVMVATCAIYYLISKSAPRSLDDPSTSNVHFGLWMGGIFGSFFFIYGAIGVLRGKMGIGWGRFYVKASTNLAGTGAFVASISTTAGGVLLLSTAAIDLMPEVGTIIHAQAALLSGLAAIILGWGVGLIVRALGY